MVNEVHERIIHTLNIDKICGYLFNYPIFTIPKWTFPKIPYAKQLEIDYLDVTFITMMQSISLNLKMTFLLLLRKEAIERAC
jgi:hypothetical protein